MKLKIALAGNPNSGKTTLFNALTGSSQYVGNWPGVTVEKKEGILKGKPDVTIQDLPGIYSLSPYTPEEVVSRTYLVNERPDAIINIIDGSNIERNLYLTTQLIELGIPMLIAINMIDRVRAAGDTIDVESLGKALGCEAVEVSALKGEGDTEAADRAVALAEKGVLNERPHVFSGSVEHALAHIEESIADKVDTRALRWFAIKVFERDERVMGELALDAGLVAHLEEHIADCEKELDDDAVSIIINQRYEYVSKLVARSVKKSAKPHSMTVSDKIDRVVTNRVLALPVFAAAMFAVYYISIGSIGEFVTNWTNDILFGEMISGNLAAWMESVNCAPWLIGLVVEGIVGGVGAVLGFVPQMFILFLMLSILEDIGYMARVAFIMDRMFRNMGLSGKSFIPLLVSSGCGVPGVMASRTIENECDRRMTIMTVCFMPCGAKMPIIALFAGALFGGSSLVAVSAYIVGVAAVVISGIILKKTALFACEPAPFVMELPPYHMPCAENILRASWERGWSFIKRAGTIILLSSVILWFLQSFGWGEAGFGMAEDNNSSLLSSIGSLVAPLFAPLGFGSWKAAVATFTGLIGKETVVGTFGVLYGFAEVAEDGAEIWGSLAGDFTRLSAYSFMLFNLLCAPCFAAMGAIRREMNSAAWTWGAIGYMCLFAYAASFVAYQIGMAATGSPMTALTYAAFAVLALTVYLLFRPNPYRGRVCTRCNACR